MIIKAKIVLFIFCATLPSATGSGEYYIIIVFIFFIECIPVLGYLHSRATLQPEAPIYLYFELNEGFLYSCRKSGRTKKQWSIRYCCERCSRIFLIGTICESRRVTIRTWCELLKSSMKAVLNRGQMWPKPLTEMTVVKLSY